MDNKTLIEKIKALFSAPEEEVQLEQRKLKDGADIEADAFEVGASVFIVSEGEKIPLPVGDYELEDGQILVVTEEGVIAEIKEAVAEPAAEDVAMEAETYNKAEVDAKFNELYSKIETLFMAQAKPEKKEEVKPAEQAIELKKEVKEVPENLSTLAKFKYRKNK